MTLSNKKKYSLWQLTDGTVVIRSNEKLPPAIQNGQFAKRPTRVHYLRHRLFRLLERI